MAVIPLRYNGELGYKKTIQQVFEFLRIRKLSVTEFLDFQDPISKSKNRDIIWNLYDDATMISYGFMDEEGILSGDESNVNPAAPCPVPITFHLDSKYLEKSVIVSQSNLLANNFSVESFLEGDKSSFLASTQEFYRDYQSNLASNRDRDGSINKDRDGDNNSSDMNSLYNKNSIKPHVYIWCKSLNSGKFSPGSVFDLSPFIISLNMTTAQTGGNFSINLAPFEGLISCNTSGEPEGIWNVGRTQYVNFDGSETEEHYFKTLMTRLYDVWVVSSYRDSNKNDFQSQSLNDLNSRSIESIKLGKYRQWTKMFFEYVISSNDIVFISYGDPFKKSGIGGIKRVDDFFIDSTSLVNGEYEMIGLVDNNSVGHSPESHEVSLSITGRDCMKLLIEDGSYFFAKSYANPDETESAFNNVDLPEQGDSNNAFNNAVSNPGAVNRLITTGILDMLFIPEARNVNFVMNMLMSRLANIEICPSELFEPWGDRRTRFSVVTEEQKDEGKDLNFVEGD